MKRAKVNELRELSLDELKSREIQLARELFNLKMRNPLRQVENPVQIRFTRREIARVKTLLKEKAGLA